MKPIHNFVSLGISALNSSAICLPPIIVCLWDCIHAAIHDTWDKSTSASLGAAVVFLVIASLFLFAANRLLCRVWIKDGYIHRKGMLCGFRKSIKIKDIRCVELHNMFSQQICFIDKPNGTFNVMRKDCYIYITNTKDNMAFVQTFWDGKIYDLPN